MLNYITYSVVFPINGVALKGEFKPQPGITAVVGPNGVGKTFTSIELARYLLFGKAALRGPASGYKKLEATGEFVIRGATYTIERKPKGEKLLDATGTVMAVNADAVTKKIIELLGYGLDVFDIANASVQKNADIFGKMRPAERKRQIDEVVGLANQELVEKACRSEGTTLQREAEALTRQLRQPVEPEKPAGYIPSAKLSEEYNNLRTLYDTAQEIASKMQPQMLVLKPKVKRPEPDDESDLQDAQDEYLSVERQRRELQPKADLPKSEYTEGELEAASQRHLMRDLASNDVTCPSCGDTFVPGHGHIVLPDGPDLTPLQIKQHYELLEGDQARKQLKKLPKLNSMADHLADVRKRETEWARYDHMIAANETQIALNRDAEATLRKLGDIPAAHEIDYLREVLFDARGYERDLAAYEKDKAVNDDLSSQIVELQRRADAFKEGSVKLSEARAAVKAYLAPKLSQVASSLLYEMTNGKLSSVEVDEDMAITVNSQPIETLSGGGETVANIALRLALGQVLVAQTFPVFFGDEMDSDADDTRREAVAAALASLVERGHLKQVILVTHRGVDIADHVIDIQ